MPSGTEESPQEIAQKRTELEREYSKRVPEYRRLIKEVKFILHEALTKSEVSFVDSVQVRIKKFKDFYEKVVRKGVGENAFAATGDVAGLRMIRLYRSDLPRIGSLIWRSFKVVKEDRKSVRARPNEFGYVSDHYIVKLLPEYRGPRYDDISQLQCEIQVRTVLMHAWAAVSHHLEYKQEMDIPAELKKDFYALSALLHLADSQFDNIRRARQSLRKELQELKVKELFDRPLNLDTLFAFLRWKLPDRKISQPGEYSRLLSSLTQAGYGDIPKLNNALDKAHQAFMVFEVDRPPLDGKYSDVGVVRVSLAILDKAFRQLVYVGSGYISKYEKLVPREDSADKTPLT